MASDRSTTATTQVIPFSELPSKQGVMDAYEALKNAGGTPPALDYLTGVTASLTEKSFKPTAPKS